MCQLKLLRNANIHELELHEELNEENFNLFQEKINFKTDSKKIERVHSSFFNHTT